MMIPGTHSDPAGVPSRPGDGSPRDAVDLVLAVLGGKQPVGIPHGLDWDRFVRLLERHGIQGLVLATHRSEPFLPDPVARVLEEAHVRTALHTTLTVEAGSRARRALQDGGIPALLFKGAALVETGVYEDPGARGMGDADLLVPPEEVGAAVEILREAGFEPWSEWDPTTVEWVDSASFSDRRSPAGVEVSLDLHWRLGYERLRYGPPARRSILWEGSGPERGRPADVPHLVVLLEHLLKHLHVTTHLRGVADVVRVAGRIESWDPVWRHVRERPTGRGMALLLDVLRLRLGAPVPPEVQGLAGIGWWRDAARSALDPRRMVTGAVGAESPGGDEPGEGELQEGSGEDRGRGLLRRWAVLGSPGLALREALHTILPEGAWLRARYGAPGGSRPGLLLRYWREVARWMRGRGSSPVSPNQEPW